jgi:hypothetical protein
MRRLILLPLFAVLLMGASATQNLGIIVTQPAPTAACPMGSSYPDGCANAPAGAPQYPHLLNKYGANRPPWNVAGVDYYVGMPQGQVLTDWEAIANPNVSTNPSTGLLSCNSGSVTLNAIDFTTHNGAFQYIYVPPGGCTALTITNSKFGCPSTGSYHLIYINNPVNFVLKYNIMDWRGCESSGSQGGSQDTLLLSHSTASASAGVIQYNYIAHTANHPFSVANVSSYDFRYNFLDDVAYDNKVGNHMDYMQMFGNNSNVLWAFNTTYQSATCCETGGEGPQFYSNGGGTLTNAQLSNNTMIAVGGNMSFMVHGSDPTTTYGNYTRLSGYVRNWNNYFDPTGASGIYYPGTMSAGVGWDSTGNINMVTGSPVVPR